MVTVIYGPNNADVPSGKSVAGLRADFAPAFNIPAGAQAFLNGVEATGGAVPTEGDTLVFSLPTGQKG